MRGLQVRCTGEQGRQRLDVHVLGLRGGSVRWTGSKWEGRRLIGRAQCYSTLPLTHGGFVDGWLPEGAAR